MRVLVGVLHSGEAEFEACLESVNQQADIDVELLTISGKPNKAAHDDLYQSFMDRKSGVDFFFKLDADMTLRSSHSLRDLVDAVVSKGAAHAMSYVFDAPSGLTIPGVQLFRSDCRWEGSEDPLNVDYAPRLFGKSVLIVNPVYVDHMSTPSDYQLFRYGIHKALKAIQHGRGQSKSVQKGLLHISIINGMVRNERLGQRRLAWALIGANLVFNDQVPDQGYHSEQVRELFDKVRMDPGLFDELARNAVSVFSNEVQNWFRWFSKFQSA